MCKGVCGEPLGHRQPRARTANFGVNSISAHHALDFPGREFQPLLCLRYVCGWLSNESTSRFQRLLASFCFNMCCACLMNKLCGDFCSRVHFQQMAFRRVRLLPCWRAWTLHDARALGTAASYVVCKVFSINTRQQPKQLLLWRVPLRRWIIHFARLTKVLRAWLNYSNASLYIWWLCPKVSRRIWKADAFKVWTFDVHVSSFFEKARRLCNTFFASKGGSWNSLMNNKPLAMPWFSFCLYQFVYNII